MDTSATVEQLRQFQNRPQNYTGFVGFVLTLAMVAVRSRRICTDSGRRESRGRSSTRTRRRRRRRRRRPRSRARRFGTGSSCTSPAPRRMSDP